MDLDPPTLTGWWFQPIWKILVNWIISPTGGENKKYLKPPPVKYSTSKLIFTLGVQCFSKGLFHQQFQATALRSGTSRVHCDTVDGSEILLTSWGWQFIPLFTWLFTSQVVQDFSINSISNPRKKDTCETHHPPVTCEIWLPGTQMTWLLLIGEDLLLGVFQPQIPTPHILCFQILIHNRTYYKEDISTHTAFCFIFKGQDKNKKNKTRAANNEKMPRPSLGSYRHFFYHRTKNRRLFPPREDGFLLQQCWTPQLLGQGLDGPPLAIHRGVSHILGGSSRTCKWIITMVSKSPK